MAVSLTEQMGAMALVDEIRHREMVVQEHINLPERRKEVSSKLHAFYEARGQRVSQELVEAGVAQYFDKRLRFELSPMSWSLRKLVDLYITRDRWSRKAAYTAAGLVLSVGFAMVMHAAIDNIYNQSVLESINKSVERRSRLEMAIEQGRQEVSDWGRLVATGSAPAVINKITSGADGALLDAKKQLAISIPNEVDSRTRDTVKARLLDVAQHLEQAERSLNAVSTKIGRARQVQDLYQEYLGVVESSGFKASVGLHATLAALQINAKRSIERIDVQGVDAAKSAVMELESALAGTPKMDSLAREVDEAIKDLEAAVGRPIDRMEQFDRLMTKGWIRAAQDALARYDEKAAAAALADLRSGAEFAKEAMTFKVVDRSGIRSGVERNYKASGGKSWYLIVEAVDDSGRVHKVPAKSVETGDSGFVTMFGIRVSEKEYQRVKQSKLASGHIDDNVMGTKAANSMVMKFNARAMDNHDMILKW